MATNLATLHKGEPVTTTLAIAEGTENQHKSVIQLVRQNQADIEEFGPIAFEMRMGKALPQGGFAKATEIAILSEPQATYLLTLMRNNQQVKTFKKTLVKAFFELRRREQQRVSRTSSIKIDKDEYIELLKAKIGFLEHKTAPRRRPLTSEERQQIRELAALGISNVEIAGQLGRSKETIRTFLRGEEQA